ncbi:MAG: DUF4397 domain-containing protein [Bacteroidetes bacterium]|nr:DUF4397 domain-containing protein [Bacteroidota bacterium]
MKHFTRLLGGGCVALFAMLFMTSSAFAQQVTYYVDIDNGGTDATACISSATNGGHPTPCDLPTVLAETTVGGANNIILIRVRRTGGDVTLEAPNPLTGARVFGTYVRGSGAAVKGTLEFEGDFVITAAGQFVLHGLASAHFEDVTITRSASTGTPFSVTKATSEKTNPAQRLTISGTLSVNASDGTVPRIQALVVSEDLKIVSAGTSPPAVVRIDSLTVNRGASLTVGTDDNPIDLRVPLRKAEKDDPGGILTVNGTIDGPGTIWIAHVDNEAGRMDEFFHMSSDYMPDNKGAIDHEDCVRIAGGGEIKNEIRAIAAGNICVEIPKIGDLSVAGSIAGENAAENVTTDVIFRNNVEVDGDVVQWNDARIVFEKNVTVKGSVDLKDGALPTNLGGFGTARTADDGNGTQVVTSIRRGVKPAEGDGATDKDPFTCEYRPKGGNVLILDVPSVSLSVGEDKKEIKVDEDVGTVAVTATLGKEHPAEIDVTIPLKIAKGGTATDDDGGDYTIPDDFEIAIASGETEETINIIISDDDAEEKDETIIVELGDLSKSTVLRPGAQSRVTITINASDADDDDGVNLFVDGGTSGMQFFKSPTASPGRGFYIPGVQFEGTATIEEDLQVLSNDIADEASETDRDDTSCAPRAIFAESAVGANNSSRQSTIGGDLVVESTREGIVLLSAATNGSSGTKERISAHNLAVDGDVFADGSSIVMMRPAESRDEGTCTTSFSLDAGTRLILTDGNDHEIIGTLTLDALVTNDDLEIDGELTVNTLHVGKGADLDIDDDVTVNEALILAGELDGSIAEDSEVKRIAYATSNSDIVSVGHELDALTISLNSGSLLFDQVAKTKNLGLCKGTLVLYEAGTDKEETLKVSEQITVQGGQLEFDANEPGTIGTDIADKGATADGYVLMYAPEGEHTVDAEWFAGVRDVVINHEKAVVILNEEGSVSIPGELKITQGHLHVKGADLAVGTGLSKGTIVLADSVRNLVISNLNNKPAAELHTNGGNLVVHGEVTVDGKLVTDGGDFHALGNDEGVVDNPKMKGQYQDSTAVVTVGAEGMIDVGTGTFQLGPAYTAKADGKTGDDRPDVTLTVAKSGDTKMGAVKGKIHIPAGSKQTYITGEAFDVITLDGTPTPKSKTANNWGGGLNFHDTKVTIDSLAAMNDAAVEFYDQTEPKTDKYAIEIKKDVALSSARIYVNGENSIKFSGDLAISGTGGFTAWDKAKVMIEGDFAQKEGTKHAGNQHGTRLNGENMKTVMGNLMVADASDWYHVHQNDQLTLNGDVHVEIDFPEDTKDENKRFQANLLFSGKEVQSLMTSAIDLDSVEVNGAGIMLESDVMQHKDAPLTLTKGVISGDHTWLVKNTTIEENLVRRMAARSGDSTCGPDNDAACSASILRGSRQSYVSAMFGRHLAVGNAGGGEVTGGYLFPLGTVEEDMSYYRPAILQLPVDPAESEAVTVSLTSVPEGATPAWPSENLQVQGMNGGFLTLDVYSDIFWKVDLGEEALSSNVNLRVAASGISNVYDSKGLRIVQWDCDWKNPQLAGQYDVSGAVNPQSFAVNDYVNGILNITHEGIDVGSCSIFGIAANQIENPIHQESLASGRSRVQFIHNAQLPAPVNLSLDGVGIASGIDFQTATGYLHVAAGGHTATIELVGAPADQAVTLELGSLINEKSYAVIAHGSLTNLETEILETRLTSLANNMVDVILVHGSADLGVVRVQTIDILDDPRTASPKRLLASNFMFDQATNYKQMNPDFYRIEVVSGNDKAGVFDLDLSGYQGQTLILNLSGSKAMLDLYAVDMNGDEVPVSVVTGTESEITEIPTEFALHGNYPNPFNPSTRIQFDLPESAQVTVQVVDMLGREVMALPAKEFEAGSNRSIELNATNLASGTYLYRMIATGAESRYVKTGRMTLVK